MTDQLEMIREALRGRYDPVRVVGRGGMATVYLAQDVKHNRSVAVKVLRPELAASIAVNRFLNEIQIAAQLNHPHILPLLDSGDVNGVLHFVMPFVEGHSLRGLLNGDPPITLARALSLTTEVADALNYAHQKGLVHRDIKPENILLSHGHAVIADFGIAKALSTAGGDALTRTGFPLGTLGYMSPEQAAGRTDLDETTDVYSLASVCYEMVVGDTPGMWVTDEAMKLLRFVDAPAAHRSRLDDIPGRVEQVLVRAMSMRPEERFASPSAFAAALEEATGQKSSHSEAQMREIIKHAAESQAEHPTEEGALSLGAIQRIGAEVGLSPARISDAAHALAGPAPAAPRRGGIFGAPPKVALERTIDAEVPVQEFESLLEEVRATMGEVGRINETLGKSLSWNSLSFQNTLEGSGRLVHVMIKPKGGQTRIRITESAGMGPAAVVLATVLGGTALGAFLAATVFENASAAVGISAMVAVFGAIYLTARRVFAGFMKRRVRVLTDLMDRLSNHVAGTSSPAHSLPRAFGEGPDDQGSPGP